MSRRPARPSRRSPRRLALAILTAAAALAGGAPQPALAGEYHVYSCKTPSGQPAYADGWKLDVSIPGGRAGWGCPGDAIMIGSGLRERWAGESVSLSIKAPEGLKFTGGTIHREMWISPGADQSATIGGLMYRDDWAYTNQTILENCQYALGCEAYGAPYERAAGGTLLRLVLTSPTDFLGYRVECRGSAGGRCAAPTGPDDRATIVLRRADLIVRDDSAPVVSNPRGTLLTDDRPLRGIETLSFGASDTGSGVYEAIVRADGKEISRQVLDDNNKRCVDVGESASDLEFMHLQPCPGSVGAQLAVDTTKLPEGQPHVVVEVRDASGNRAVVIDERLAVDNIPAPRNVTAPVVTGDAIATGVRPGDRLVALDGAWEGAGLQFARRWQRSDASGWVDIPNASGAAYGVSTEDVGRRLRVVVSAVNAEGVTEAASAQTAVVDSGATVQTQSRAPGGSGSASCDGCNGAGGDASTGQLVVDREQRSVQVRYGAKLVITGRLVDSEGRPLADAAVDVFERVEVVGAPWRQVATVKTDSQGGYVYRPRTTSSRALRFAYAAKRGAADYRATRDVTVAVQAGMTARAVKRLVSPNGKIQLVGRVKLEGLPRTGTWVEIQVLDAGVWRTIGTRRTTRTGLWKFNHRLRRSAGVTFKFRARVRVSSDLPSAESSSGAVKVRVR